MQVVSVHFACVAKSPRKPRVDVSLLRPFAQRLRQARILRGYSSAAEAIEAFGFETTYESHEADSRVPKQPTAARYAKAFGVSLSWLLTGEGEMESVRIIGEVGAGDSVYPFDGDQGAPSYAQRPANAEGDIEALIVRGDSMYPVYRDNDLIIYEKRFVDLDQLIGRECVVRLKDGRSLIKILRRGPRKGRYNLESFNGAPIEAVEIEAAYPVRWIEKRWQTLAPKINQR